MTQPHWKRRLVAPALIFLAVVAIGSAYTMTLPDRYEARSIIHLSSDDYLDVAVEGLTPSVSAPFNFEKRLLTRPNIEKVAKETDLDLFAQTPAQHESMLLDLAQRIHVERLDDSLLEIRFRDREPQRAYKVVSEVLSLFVENSLGERRRDISRTRTFLEDEIERYEERLNKTGKRRREFEEANLAYLTWCSLPGTSLSIALQQRLQASAREGPEEIARRCPMVRVQWRALNRDYVVVDDMHVELTRRLEQLQLLERSRHYADDTRLVIIEPPRVPLNPVAPNRPLMLGFILALASVAFGLVWWLIRRIGSQSSTS